MSIGIFEIFEIERAFYFFTEFLALREGCVRVLVHPPPPPLYNNNVYILYFNRVYP